MSRFFAIIFITLTTLAPAWASNSLDASGSIPCPPPTAATPVWGKLVIMGNDVTCYYAKGAAQPTVWTQIGSPQTIGFINNPLLIGMYLTAHDTTGAATLSTGTIDNFSITPAPTYKLADCDIGAPALMGSANFIGGVWNLAGSGADIWGTFDQCNFQPWLVWGDCTVICRITSLSSGDYWQKIGIMVRDGFNSGSDYGLFCASYGCGVNFQYRATFNNNHDATTFVAPPAPGVMSSVAIGLGQTGSTSYIVRP